MVMCSLIVQRILLRVRAVVCDLICRKYERGENGDHRVRKFQRPAGMHFLYTWQALEHYCQFLAVS